MSLKNSGYKLIGCGVDSEVYHRDGNPNAIKVYGQNIRPERILRYHLYHLELSTRQYIPLESWKNPSSLIEDTFVFCGVEIRGMVVRILSLNPNAAYFGKFYGYTQPGVVTRVPYVPGERLDQKDGHESVIREINLRFSRMKIPLIPMIGGSRGFIIDPCNVKIDSLRADGLLSVTVTDLAARLMLIPD